MGGGSALLINSNRRGSAGGSEFGCTGWFCDVLDGAMMLLVVMVIQPSKRSETHEYLQIILTAIIGCFKACLSKTSVHYKRESQSTTELPPVRTHETEEPPLPPLQAIIVMENPPDYAENDQNLYLPPAYCSLE
ncbi:Protein CBG08708 [Caenorhabditis briggsae]|uniref:Protein CBG08708 n=1 Tax=Caenorhabditis briggsae TaxID=6238 RepID=A8X776_CAEBR|nr:Protein CBG08708 [Caenorhabditis briggsae]CAP28487.1 Protein CBG08708 [Caenorhabditis briggsae]